VQEIGGLRTRFRDSSRRTNGLLTALSHNWPKGLGRPGERLTEVVWEKLPQDMSMAVNDSINGCQKPCD
jgi:hypothetical protein